MLWEEGTIKTRPSTRCVHIKAAVDAGQPCSSKYLCQGSLNTLTGEQVHSYLLCKAYPYGLSPGK